MMVALLLYAYAVGERSSRGIERRCREDVAFRVIGRERFVWPDHVEPEVSDEARRAAAAMTLEEALAFALSSID
jgi:hypothetical protein